MNPGIQDVWCRKISTNLGWGPTVGRMACPCDTASQYWFRGKGNFSSRASGISDQSSSPVIILCYNSTWQMGPRVVQWHSDTVTQLLWSDQWSPVIRIPLGWWSRLDKHTWASLHREAYSHWSHVFRIFPHCVWNWNFHICISTISQMSWQIYWQDLPYL